MTHYTAITIGPIYRIIQEAKRTRAVWAASYFFSWFMKKLLEEIKKDSFIKIMMPYYETPYDSQYGAGLYADRIYLMGDSSHKEKIQDCTDNILKMLSGDIVKTLNEERKKKDPSLILYEETDVINFLRSYLNIHIVHTEIEDSPQALKTLNGLLDNRELQLKYCLDAEPNYLIQYLNLRTSDNKNVTLIQKDAWGESGRWFRSTPEISSSGLNRPENEHYKKIIAASFKNYEDKIKKKSEEVLDYEILDELEQNDGINGFKKYHKYYGVIYADGDNISNILTEVSGKPELLLGFSKQLLVFGKEAEQTIANYGGNGIYLGGEDILCFVPLACPDSNDEHLATVLACPDSNDEHLATVFELITKLDENFASTIGLFAKEQGVIPPTLSYGISLSYAKSPLQEAMKQAHDLLHEVKVGELTLKHNLTKQKRFPNKNTIALRLQRHSGQYMECYIDKGHKASWELIHKLVSDYTKDIKDIDEKNNDLLSGVIHRIKDDVFYEVLVAAARTNDPERLKAFFDNFFNESVHQDKKFLNDVQELVQVIFEEYPDNKQCRDILFTVLKFIYFIAADKD
jgi:CRISPR-associated protein Cmr2